ncbi:MAG TPA: cytochrome-c peroxidase [Solibacterales bacterium]|nr:cytochrome-c peroxidase [Bryobacterales bacterium]
MRYLMIPMFVLTAFAQRGGGNGGGANLASAPLGSLKTVALPPVIGIERYVQDPEALIVLGKALFWDVQAGSDGRTACATCHFHAGADHRLRNQMSGAGSLPNQTLSLGDFPFRLLSNPGNNQSAALRDNRYVMGSAGVVERLFAGIAPGLDIEESVSAPSPGSFSLGGVLSRQVTSRNSPTVINAVFNARNFWDGRASSLFTGATPFGDSDTNPNVWVWKGGQLTAETVRLENASLASQAAGPPLNHVEMSWKGRTWPMLGRKLLAAAPLARQRVAHDDSVLGPLANPGGNGLLPGIRYAGLIEQAFHPDYWSAPQDGEDPSQIERNFGLFWALAIQAYERTLVSDDSRVDRFFAGETSALSALERQGLNEFQNGGSQCARCHGGPEFTAAAFTSLANRPDNGDPSNAGFFRIGVSPIEEDIGLGGADDFSIPLFQPARPGAADGVFKAPSLRNVELTGPYFHNGSQATLEQVLAFYRRNGDIAAGGNLGPGIGQIRLGQQDQTAIVAFLKALTDDRVRYQRAPFDHPSLCVPDGHQELSPGVLSLNLALPGLVAADQMVLVPAVGRNGSSVPLQTFEELLRGIGRDGTRANTMSEACPAQD